MKNTEFDNLIRNLRNQKPELNNAEFFSDSIMAQITSRSHRTKPRLLIWIRTVSSAAALLLLGLFASQQNDVKVAQFATNRTNWTDRSVNIDSLCMQKTPKRQMNLMEVYYCHMQRNSEKNKLQESIYQQIKN